MKSGIVSAALGVARLAAVAVAALSMAAGTAGAQNYGQRELFEWRGNVDQEVRIEMQGGRTSTIAMGPREMVGYDNARAMSGIPATNGYVSVQIREGRGIADVVQQPTARNGYTTIVRVRDGQSGAGQYDIAAFWQSSGNGNYGYGNRGYGQYGNNGNNDNNGAYGRDADDGYGQYGNYGAYGRYPQQVIVQRPVYQQPVYGNGGKTLPSVNRGTVYQQPVYGNGGYNRYPGATVQTGKTLPGNNQARRTDGDRHHRDDNRQGQYNQNQNGQSGKTLPR